MTKQKEKSFIFRIPKELHREAKIKAAETGRPLSEILRELLEEWTKKKVQ